MAERQYTIRISAADRVIVAVDDFRIRESSFTILFGESGIGKSLSALAIAGLIDPDQLEVQIDGRPYETYLRSEDVRNIRQNGFFVFQEPSSHLNPLLKLRTQLKEGSLGKSPEDESLLKRLWPGSSPSHIDEILDVFPKPYRPSGGEKQRILSAMAFKKMSLLDSARPGSLFVFDEPTGSLDNELRNQFLDILVENFRKRRITVLLITHDYSMVSRFAKSYQAIASQLCYKEFLRDGDRLRLRDFEPAEYLTWISGRKPASMSRNGDGTLLKLDPTIRVFGHTLTVSREQGKVVPAPLSIRKGVITYLKAPSGTGKTTLVKVVMGLLRAETMSMELGKMKFTETTPRSVWSKEVWGRRMAMVFQHADEALNQNARVRDIFAGLPVTTSFTDTLVVNTLAGLFDEKPDKQFLNKFVKHLSGGQKQRLNLLRSLILETDIVILDEPLNGLDFSSAVKVLDNVGEKLKEGKGVLVISHNEEIFDALVKPEDTYYLHAR